MSAKLEQLVNDISALTLLESAELARLGEKYLQMDEIMKIIKGGKS